MKTLTIATASAMLIGQCAVTSSGLAATATVGHACAPDIRSAISETEKALDAESPADDRLALKCLIEAVAALDKKLQGITDGSLPFEGQVYAPKGITVGPPSDQGGR